MGRETWGGEGEEQKLALALRNTADQIHGRDGIESPPVRP